MFRCGHQVERAEVCFTPRGKGDGACVLGSESVAPIVAAFPEMDHRHGNRTCCFAGVCRRACPGSKGPARGNCGNAGISEHVSGCAGNVAVQHALWERSEVTGAPPNVRVGFTRRDRLPVLDRTDAVSSAAVRCQWRRDQVPGCVKRSARGRERGPIVGRVALQHEPSRGSGGDWRDVQHDGWIYTSRSSSGP